MFMKLNLALMAFSATRKKEKNNKIVFWNCLNLKQVTPW